MSNLRRDLRETGPSGISNKIPLNIQFAYILMYVNEGGKFIESFGWNPYLDSPLSRTTFSASVNSTVLRLKIPAAVILFFVFFWAHRPPLEPCFVLPLCENFPVPCKNPLGEWIWVGFGCNDMEICRNDCLPLPYIHIVDHRTFVGTHSLAQEVRLLHA